MNKIGNNILNEDRYIAHLAGLKNGKSPIHSRDMYKASAAQNHPVSNTIGSVIGGSISAVAVTAFGALAYPLTSSTVRDTFFGKNVCGPCTVNTAKITASLSNFYLNAAPYLDSLKAYIDPNFKAAPEVPSFLKNIFSSFLGLGSGVTVGVACGNDNKGEVELTCRGINYAGSVVDTVTENSTVFGVAALGLAALFAYSQFSSYNAEETKAGSDLKDTLSVRYLQIASRLKNLEANEETKALSKAILERQFQMHNELKNLELPNMSWREIEYITLPVLLAAKEKLAEANQS